MDRLIGHGYRESIGAALRMIPLGLHHLLDADFLCGSDPIFVGLHEFRDATDGRSYLDTAHCAYPHHQLRLPKTQRRTTVVLPVPESPEVVVHELGHALHARLEWEHDADPVTRYAHVNRFESFAEAFTSWCIPGYADVPDPATRDYFDRLTWERG